MANQNEFFKVNGAKELGNELKALTRGMNNTILRPALREATGEVRKVAKTYVPVQSGVLKSSIKNKVFTSKRNAKGVVGRVGIFVKGNQKVKNGNKMVHPATYGATLEHGTDKAGAGRSNYIGARNFLSNALQSAEPIATQRMIARTQIELDKFHAKQAAKYK